MSNNDNDANFLLNFGERDLQSSTPAIMKKPAARKRPYWFPGSVGLGMHCSDSTLAN
jgi:hypothetical protein